MSAHANNEREMLKEAINRAFAGAASDAQPAAGGWVLAITGTRFNPVDSPRYRDQLFDELKRAGEKEGTWATVLSASFARTHLEHFSENGTLKLHPTERTNGAIRAYATSGDLYLKVYSLDADALLIDPRSITEVRAILDPEMKQDFYPGPFKSLEFGGVVFPVQKVVPPEDGIIRIHI